MRIRSLRGVVTLGALALLLCGCVTVTAVLPPASMRVSIDVKDYHQGTTQVAIHFADASLNTVEFVHGETVACNGVYLKYDSGFYARLFGYSAYVGEVPLQPTGGAYTFAFTPATGAAVALPVPVVAAPVTSIQPAAGATVSIPSSAPLVVRYAPSGVSNSAVVGSAVDSRYHVALALTLADTGSVAFNTRDFASFSPGPGTVSLSRITSSKPGGTPFAQVDVGYENIATVQVLWA